MKKWFFRSNPAWSLIIILNLPIIAIGLITVSFLFKNVSDDIKELNINTSVYMQQLSENIFEKTLSISYLVAESDMYSDFTTFFSQENPEISSAFCYNMRGALKAAATSNPSLPINDIFVYSPLSQTAITTNSVYSFDEIYDLYFSGSRNSAEDIKNKIANAKAQAFIIPSRITVDNDTDTEVTGNANSLILCRKLHLYSKKSGFFFAVLDMRKFMDQMKNISGDYLLDFGIYDSNNTLLFNELLNGGDSSVLDTYTPSEYISTHNNKTIINNPSDILNISYAYVFDEKNLSGDIPNIVRTFIFLELLALIFSLIFGSRRIALIDKSLKALSQSNNSLRKNLMENQLYLQTQVISELINGRNSSSYDALYDKYEIDLSQSFMRIMVIRFADNKPWKDILRIYPEISRTISDAFSRYNISCYFAGSSEAEYCMLLNYSDEDIMHTVILSLSDEISRQCRCDIPLYFGLSEKIIENNNMRMFYDDAKSSVGYGINNQFSITYYDDIKNDNLTEIYYPNILERQLYNSIKSGKTDDTSTILDKIYQTNFVTRKPPYYLLQKLICLMQTLLYRLIDELYEDNGEMRSKYIRACRNITLNNDSSENYQFIREIALSIVSDFESGSLNNVMKTRIEECISENFSNPDFSLATLAAHINISYHHLSHIFTDYMGDTFLSYLTKYRLEHAKDLLAQSNEKIDTIAKLSGFSSSNTFIKTFKKNYNMTPGQYRSNSTDI